MLRLVLDRAIPRPPSFDATALPKLVVVATLLASAAISQQRSTSVRLVALLVFGGLLVVVLLRRPELGVPGLMLAAAFVPFEADTGTNTKVNVVFLGVLGLGGIWLLRMWLAREIVLPRSEANLPWIVLIVTAGLSIVVGAAFWNPWVVPKGDFVVVQLAQCGIIAASALAFWLGGGLARDRRSLAMATAVLMLIGVVFAVNVVAWAARINIGRLTLLEAPMFRLWVVALSSGLALFHFGLSTRLRVCLFALAGVIVFIPAAGWTAWVSGWFLQAFTLAVVVLIFLWSRVRWLSIVSALVLTVYMAVFVIPGLLQTDAWSLGTRIAIWKGLLGLLGERWPIGLGAAAYWHYWRGVYGVWSYLDPVTGFFHADFTPSINAHNNYLDMLMQMGVFGLVAYLFLLVAVIRQSLRVFRSCADGFSRAYAAACLGGVAGMICAGMLGDWIIPFVYNIGLSGFRDSFFSWVVLGGLSVIEGTYISRARHQSRTPPHVSLAMQS